MLTNKGHPRIYKLGSVSRILHRIPFEPTQLRSKPNLALLQMSSPQDLASGTNSRAVYKERVGDRRIKQFDARKFPYARTNVLTPYPTVNQVTSISGFDL